MTANEYQKLAARTMNKKLMKNEQLMHALHGMAAEVGEVHGLYQKVYQGHFIKTEYLKKELGDVLWMIAEACTALDFELEEIMQLNINKLKARYPQGFEEARSRERAEGDI